MAAISAFLEPLYFFEGPLRIFEAATRSFLTAEMQRASTASAIVGASRPDQVHDNAGAAGTELASETLAEIDAILSL